MTTDFMNFNGDSLDNYLGHEMIEINEDSAKKASLFYETFVQGKIYTTDDKTAEMVKLLENEQNNI